MPSVELRKVPVKEKQWSVDSRDKADAKDRVFRFDSEAGEPRRNSKGDTGRVYTEKVGVLLR